MCDMETTNFEDPMFSEFSSDAMLNSMAPKAIQHHHFVTTSHHHHHHHPQTIMMTTNGDMNQHTTRLPGISEIHPKNDGLYKTHDYTHVKTESPSYSPNGKIEYLNGCSTKLESYSSPSNGGSQKLEYISNGQYSPNAKITEYPTSVTSLSGQQHIEHIQLYHQTTLDGHQQTLINEVDGNYKGKSEESLNNLSGSPTPTTIINSSISPSNGNAVSSPSKKASVDKKKNDPNGVKKKKTRYGYKKLG